MEPHIPPADPIYNSVIAIGSNDAGSRPASRFIAIDAVRALQTRGFEVSAASRLYANPAYPPGSGPEYVNAAVLCRTAQGAEAAMSALHDIEAAFGRQREVRWGTRTLDLDLIDHGGLVLPDAQVQSAWAARTGEARLEVPPGVILPHPRLTERAFVLVPLAEVAPGWRHPVTGEGVDALIGRLPAEDLRSLRPLSTAIWPEGSAADTLPRPDGSST